MIPIQKKVAVTTGSREAQGLYEVERTRELQFLPSRISEPKMALHKAWIKTARVVVSRMKVFSMKRWRGTQKIGLESGMNEKLQHGIVFIGHSW